MNHKPLLLSAVVVALAAPAAHAQTWDSRGWVMLGERSAEGRVDHERIEVGRYEGRFNKLTLVVEGGDIALFDFRVEFGDRSEFHPMVKQVFREGQRTRVFELPEGERVIRYIDFKYHPSPNGPGVPHVQVWAWRVGPAVAPAFSWDNHGWTMLGEREVRGHGRENNDRIEVGRYEGRFSKLNVVVLDADLEMIDMNVRYGRGSDWHPAVAQFFRENQRTRVLDFPAGEVRTIQFIDFRYRNVPGEGHARVQVWGKAEAAPPPPAAFNWESRGWTMLGEREVHGHGREEMDHIEVGSAEGRFHKVNIVVLDSDLEMIDFSIKFHHGEPFHPAVNQIFRENTRLRSIDLPGDERTIRWIEFKYRNLPGEGHARVQVWAK